MMERQHAADALNRASAALDGLDGLSEEEVLQRDGLQAACYQIRAVLRDDDWLHLIRGATPTAPNQPGELHAA